MSGPEHYKRAQEMLREAEEIQSDSGPGCGSEEVIAAAQVHATLALAAATAEAGGLVKAESLSGLSPWAQVLNGGSS